MLEEPSMSARLPTLLLCAALASGLAVVVAACTSRAEQPAPQRSVGLITDDRPLIPPPDAAAAWVPEGYRVEVAHAGLIYPTSVAFDDEGNLYVAEGGYMPGDAPRPPRILRYAGGATNGRVIASAGLTGPVTDLMWHRGRLYISHKGKISVLEDGGVKDLVTDLPSLGDHSNNAMCVGPDGRLYFGQGSATNAGVVGVDDFAFGWVAQHPEVCDVPAKDITLAGQSFESEDPRTPGGKARTSAFQPFGKTAPRGTVVKGQVKANGTVLSMQPDGSDLRVFAWGFRNPYGLAWTPDGRLLVADAGSDERGSRQIANEPEKLWVAREDAFYGWPDFAAGLPVSEAQFHPAKAAAPEPLLVDPPAVEKPLMSFEPHASITQMDIGRGAAFGKEGRLFLASSGDQSPVTAAKVERSGYWVKCVDLATGKAEDFFHAKEEALGPQGLEYVRTAGPRRLVDLAFTPDGNALYVVDIGPIHYVNGEHGPTPVAFPGTGVLWKITRSAQAVAQTQTASLDG
jgi:glucose/arabinose dehydrogenase